MPVCWLLSDVDVQDLDGLSENFLWFYLLLVSREIGHEVPHIPLYIPFKG